LRHLMLTSGRLFLRLHVTWCLHAPEVDNCID